MLKISSPEAQVVSMAPSLRSRTERDGHAGTSLMETMLLRVIKRFEAPQWDYSSGKTTSPLPSSVPCLGFWRAWVPEETFEGTNAPISLAVT